ncbi:MAG: hypothetical protein A3E01_09985 [Gammaproteobacteria bacterium RIFCSPHIGHO2_12_FULL_63_22]|nr:MAG: hypothetical protein A3E01_09985 [Gammaproteobacteria bacterium RIFCSPHIGHO2_12_FULL_63_22]
MLAGPIIGPLTTAATVALGLALAFVWIRDRVVIGRLERQVTELHQQIDDPATGWRARLSTCQTNGVTLTEAIGRQNTAVEEMQRNADAIAASARAAVAAVRAEGTKAASAATNILSRPRPAAGDECRAAFDLLRERAP